MNHLELLWLGHPQVLVKTDDAALVKHGHQLLVAVAGDTVGTGLELIEGGLGFRKPAPREHITEIMPVLESGRDQPKLQDLDLVGGRFMPLGPAAGFWTRRDTF